MKFASLGSGSRGNAVVVQSSDACVLLDCGIAIGQLKSGLERLNLCFEDFDAVFISHEHGDHIKGVKSFVRKRDVPVYMTYGTAAKGGCEHLPQLRLLDNHSPVEFGSLLVQPVVVPHDAREPCQFVVTDRTDGAANGCLSTGKQLGVLTDLGSFTPHVIAAYSTCDAVVLECNHDVEMLEAGPYPYSLKRRVRGDWGHLSNQQASELLAQLNCKNIQWLVLAHISQKNNTAELALEAVNEVFPYSDRTLVADQDEGFDWLEII